MKLFLSTKTQCSKENRAKKEKINQSLPVVPILEEICPARGSPGICDFICLEMMETANPMKARDDQNCIYHIWKYHIGKKLLKYREGGGKKASKRHGCVLLDCWIMCECENKIRFLLVSWRCLLFPLMGGDAKTEFVLMDILLKTYIKTIMHHLMLSRCAGPPSHHLLVNVALYNPHIWKALRESWGGIMMMMTTCLSITR